MTLCCFIKGLGHVYKQLCIKPGHQQGPHGPVLACTHARTRRSLLCTRRARGSPMGWVGSVGPDGGRATPTSTCSSALCPRSPTQQPRARLVQSAAFSGRAVRASPWPPRWQRRRNATPRLPNSSGCGHAAASQHAGGQKPGEAQPGSGSPRAVPDRVQRHSLHAGTGDGRCEAPPCPAGSVLTVAGCADEEQQARRGAGAGTEAVLPQTHARPGAFFICEAGQAVDSIIFFLAHKPLITYCVKKASSPQLLFPFCPI